jgi:hypothetical protein
MGWEDFYVTGNMSIIESKVDVGEGGVATETDRPLQGQSPYVFNLALSYDNPHTKFTSTLLYNVYGKRITTLGTFGQADIYEQPYHQVDFIFNYTFMRPLTSDKRIQSPHNWSLKFKASNLLPADVEFTQDGRALEAYYKSTSFSLGLKYKFQPFIDYIIAGKKEDE